MDDPMMYRTILLAACFLFIASASRAGAEDRPLTAADAAAGKQLYMQECSGCHGERGKGDGPAAAFVDPQPRNFVASPFKFRTTPAGEPPATADILRIIERGMAGTAMPAFAFLPEEDRKKIAAYVLKLADILDEDEPVAFGLPHKQSAATAATRARGKEAYALAGCATCHGELGKGDGPSAATLLDADDRPIKVRDLTREAFRGGAERIDLYVRFMAGIDGTPMPAYGEALAEEDMWALVDYVQSLRVPAEDVPLPAEAIAAGRQIAAKYSCRGCHVLDDGEGGMVGPDLRVSGQKLHPEWVRTFLRAPREYGKIYPWHPYRMPHLGLDDAEVDVMTRYLATIGKRTGEPILPDPASFPPEKLAEGQLTYMLRCTECHNLGTVIETPPIKRQGPDLIHVAPRVDYEWAKQWILNPRKIDAKTKMTVPGLTPDQVDAVRMFVWKASMEADAAAQARAGRP
jgi:mono/diheme cytochrome c family protein